MLTWIIKKLAKSDKNEQEVTAVKTQVCREIMVVTKKIERANNVINKKTMTYNIARAMGVLR